MIGSQLGSEFDGSTDDLFFMSSGSQASMPSEHKMGRRQLCSHHIAIHSHCPIKAVQSKLANK